MRAPLLFACLLVWGCKVKEEPKRTPAPSPPAAESSEGAFMPGHLIVKTKPGASLPSEVLARQGLVKMKDLSSGATLYRVVTLDASAPDARTRTLAILDELRKDPNVEYAQLDHVLTFQ